MYSRLFLAVFAIIPILGFAESSQDLDLQIKKLKDARTRAAMEAYIAGSDAERFLSRDWEDYEQALHEQEINEEKVHRLTAKINSLEQQKAALSK